MLEPTGNNTRANLVTEILSQLNDPNNEFWTNAMIQTKLQRVVTQLYNQNNRMNSERNKRSFDFYYEANKESVVVVNQKTITSANKWIDVDLGAGEVSASVPEGVYNGLEELRAAIETALQALDATFECSYNASIVKFEISRTGNFTIKWNTGSHAGSTLADILGFSTAADDNGGNSVFTADNEKGPEKVGRLKLTMLEDRTDQQPGPLWHPSESIVQQHQDGWVLQNSGLYNEMPKYIINYLESNLDGVPWIDLVVIASPIPTSRRTLRLHFQGGVPILSVDYARSGLMPEEEEVAVLRTCILAKFQEIDKAPKDWKDQLKEAEMDMRQAVRPIKRGPKRVTYTPD